MDNCSKSGISIRVRCGHRERLSGLKSTFPLLGNFVFQDTRSTRAASSCHLVQCTKYLQQSRIVGLTTGRTDTSRCRSTRNTRHFFVRWQGIGGASSVFVPSLKFAGGFSRKSFARVWLFCYFSVSSCPFVTHQQTRSQRIRRSKAHHRHRRIRQFFHSFNDGGDVCLEQRCEFQRGTSTASQFSISLLQTSHCSRLCVRSESAVLQYDAHNRACFDHDTGDRTDRRV